MGDAGVAIKIRLATWADKADIAGVLSSGFADEELHDHMFPGKEQFKEDYVRAWRETIEERWWNYARIWVLVELIDENRRKVVGAAEWQRSGQGWESLWGSRGVWDPRNSIQHAVKSFHKLRNWWAPNRSMRQPTSLDPLPLSKPNFGPRIGPFMNGLFPHETYWELCTLAVGPDVRRQGLGKELVRWGLIHAEQEDLPVCVVTARDTEPFYKGCGFGHCLGILSEIQIEGLTNPLTERGLGGGAVLWTRGHENSMIE